MARGVEHAEQRHPIYAETLIRMSSADAALFSAIAGGARRLTSTPSPAEVGQQRSLEVLKGLGLVEIELELEPGFKAFQSAIRKKFARRSPGAVQVHDIPTAPISVPPRPALKLTGLGIQFAKAIGIELPSRRARSVRQLVRK